MTLCGPLKDVIEIFGLILFLLIGNNVSRFRFWKTGNFPKESYLGSIISNVKSYNFEHAREVYSSVNILVHFWLRHVLFYCSNNCPEQLVLGNYVVADLNLF